MEATKNKIPEEANVFFKNISNYLDTKLYFFGSVQREDYIPGHSDIDVDIFTENEYSTITKMTNYLHYPTKKFKKFVCKLESDKVAYGHKVNYRDPSGKFVAEFSIYNEKFKNDILQTHNGKIILPFYVLWLLTILKVLFYQLQWISIETFKYIKLQLLTTGIGKKVTKFIVLDEDPDVTNKKIEEALDE